MTDRIESLIAIAVMIALSLVFQVQLKILANAIAPIFARSDLGSAARLAITAGELASWRFVAILAISFLLFALWLFTLTRLDLSVALPVASLALVLNSIGGGLLLGEPMTMMRAAGIATVGFGILLVIKS